jgi:GDPmannose 4,6-dehydratase
VELLIGDSTKAKEKMGWEPKYNLATMTSEMVKSDIELFKQNRLLKEAGFVVKNEFE